MDFTGKAILEFAVLIVILLIIGFLMQQKMNGLLNAALEQSIARQTADFSLLAEERFNRELAELAYAAKYMEAHPEELGDILSGFESLEDKGVTSGLLNLEDGAIIGNTIDEKAFPRLRRAFRGNAIIDYAENLGLLFAVPVYHGDNVRYTLYRLYRPELLTEVFGLAEYDADSRILIREQSGKLIVPYVGYGYKDQEFFADPEIEAGFSVIREKLTQNKSAAVYSEGPKGKFFLFGADLPQTNCSIVGYVPWEAVAGSISRIYLLVSTVVALLLLLFAIASIYLFMMQARAAESDALKAAKRIADQANAAKSKFLSQMSHEIRTPINAVLGLNEMILRESKESEIQVYAHKIDSAGHALLAIINDVLDFSKIESGHLELIVTRYAPAALLRDIITLTEPRARQKGLKLFFHVEETIPRELWGDAARIRQILVNLVTNAVKYTPKGQVDVFVSGKGEDLHTILLEIKVKDTGIGIREEDKAKLFHDFERFDAVKNRTVEGTGLGLAITYQLLKLMEGEISVESEYGKGSTFSLKIPQRVSSFDPMGEFCPESEQAEALRHHIAGYVAPEAKILIVDDNEMNLFVAKNLLKNTKMSVTTCLSGKECIERMTREHFDVVLLDHMMPEMDGIETIKRIHAMEDFPCKGTPVIALTANAIAEAREMFLSAGFAAYLTKPIDGTLLEKTLLEFLPKSKITAKNAPSPESPPSDTIAKNSEHTEDRIDRKLGLLYNGGMEDMYLEVLAMFAQLKDSKKAKIDEALEKEDWKAYTTFVHALKSTSLTIGCKELSEGAKALEMAGKGCQAEDLLPEERENHIAYIREHHKDVMKLYDAVAQEAGEMASSSETPQE